MTAPVTTPEPLLAGDTADALVERVAQLGQTGAPLAAGLRAAADETDSWRLAGALRRVAAEIERGRPLDDVIAAATRRLPSHLAGLIRAAQRTGSLGDVLAQWLENRRAAREHWRRVVASLTYPAITLVLAIAIYLLLSVAVVQPFQAIVEDFGLITSVNFTVARWMGSSGLWVLAVVFAAPAIALLLLRIIGGPAAWSAMVTQVPFVGNCWHWTGVAEMLRSLALLLKHKLPLGDALRLTGGGISDAHVGGLCRDLATRLDQGTPLFMAIVHQRSLPLSIVPLVRWGEENNVLPEALESAAEMLEGRLRIRLTLIVQILPPLIFITVGMIVISLLFGVFSTLIPLIQGLS